MYGYCQQLPMPTTPGIKWVKNKRNNLFNKEIMTHSHSLACQQWLEWKQVSDSFLIQKDKKRTKIQMKYFRGEVKLYNSQTKNFSWAVDGFAENQNGAKVYEFLGERWHKGCPFCGDGEEDETFLRKKSDILKMGYQLEIIWGCQWEKLLETVKNVPTSFPRILHNRSSELELLEGIRNESLFGYLICDIKSPETVIKKWENFPLVIKREQIDLSYLSEDTKLQIENDYGSSSTFKRNTLIQCFNDQNHLLFSPMAKFYLDEGLEISNVKTFIQYQPDTCLKPFIEKVTKMRIEAEYDRKFLKGETAKIIGNSGYGKGS